MREVAKLTPEIKGGNKGARARLIRNRQATAMLEVSLALLKVKKYNEEGGSREDVSHDLAALSKFLRDSAF